MLASSLNHQQHMLELTQADRELAETNKALKGKSTQTVEGWGPVAKGQKHTQEKGWEDPEPRPDKRTGSPEWSPSTCSPTRGNTIYSPASNIQADTTNQRVASSSAGSVQAQRYGTPPRQAGVLRDSTKTTRLKNQLVKPNVKPEGGGPTGKERGKGKGGQQGQASPTYES